MHCTRFPSSLVDEIITDNIYEGEVKGEIRYEMVFQTSNPRQQEQHEDGSRAHGGEVDGGDQEDGYYWFGLESGARGEGVHAAVAYHQNSNVGEERYHEGQDLRKKVLNLKLIFFI